LSCRASKHSSKPKHHSKHTCCYHVCAIYSLEHRKLASYNAMDLVQHFAGGMCTVHSWHMLLKLLKPVPCCVCSQG
jgi:hypothetical protein